MKAMRISYIIIFFLFGISSFSIYSQERKKAVLIRPLPLAAGLGIGMVDISLEGQFAYKPNISLSSITGFALSQHESRVSLLMGPQFRPQNDYLNGIFIGLYPGYKVRSSKLSDNAVFYHSFIAQLESGYEWVFENGYTMNISGGVLYTSNTAYGSVKISPYQFSIALGIGYSFSRKNALQK